MGRKVPSFPEDPCEATHPRAPSLQPLGLLPAAPGNEVGEEVPLPF